MIKIKAQAWSIDIALAVVVFIVAFFIIYNIISTRTTGISNFQKEAERISKEATSENSSLSIVNKEILNETKIKNLLEQNYSEIKKKIRVENEFCIYLEDEEGNLIKIQNASGLGSPEINVSGVACG